MYCTIKILNENEKVIDVFYAENRQQYANLIEQLQFAVPPDCDMKFEFDPSAGKDNMNNG